MAKRTIARLFDTSAAAHAAVNDLERAGFAHDDVTYMGNQGDQTDLGVAANDPDTTTTRTSTSTTETGAATGATLGTVVGGGAGLLAGIGAIAIPGVGPVVAAGWLIAALTGAGVGAAAGGLLGTLTTAGLGEESATTYTEGLRRGGHLVVVRAEESRAVEAERILESHHPVDVESRQEEWRAAGWTGSATGAGADTIRPGTTTGMAGDTRVAAPGGTAMGADRMGTAPGGFGGTLGGGGADSLPGANDPSRLRRGDVA